MKPKLFLFGGLMQKALQNDIQKYGLMHAGDTVVVAVSGGRDSMALLFGLHNLRETLQIQVVAAHFNHALRGADSDADEAFVQHFCAQYGIDFLSTTMPIGELSAGKNLQETARFYRYLWLHEIADRYGNAETVKIATAHHAQDQAETLLLHLLRGSGSGGLKGMEPKMGRLIRPLLHVERRVLEDYLQQHHISYRDDASNFSSHYTRNKIRLELLPLLAEYNPAVVQALGNTADICREEDHFLEEAVNKLIAEISTPYEAGFAINRKQLNRAPLALKRRLVRILWQKVSGNLHGGLCYEHTQAVLKLVKGKKIPLPQQVMAIADAMNIYLLPRAKEDLSTPAREKDTI